MCVHGRARVGARARTAEGLGDPWSDGGGAAGEMAEELAIARSASASAAPACGVLPLA